MQGMHQGRLQAQRARIQQLERLSLLHLVAAFGSMLVSCHACSELVELRARYSPAAAGSHQERLHAKRRPPKHSLSCSNRCDEGCDLSQGLR